MLGGVGGTIALGTLAGNGTLAASSPNQRVGLGGVQRALEVAGTVQVADVDAASSGIADVDALGEVGDGG